MGALFAIITFAVREICRRVNLENDTEKREKRAREEAAKRLRRGNPEGEERRRGERVRIDELNATEARDRRRMLWRAE